MAINDVTAWAWAQAAVSQRLIGANIDQTYLAEFYATNLATKTNAQIKEGAARIREIKAVADIRDDGAYATTVEERDELAMLLEPVPSP